MADALVSGISDPRSCRFKSCFPHQEEERSHLRDDFALFLQDFLEDITKKKKKKVGASFNLPAFLKRRKKLLRPIVKYKKICYTQCMKSFDPSTLLFLYRSFRLFKMRRLYFSTEESKASYADMELKTSLQYGGLVLVLFLFLWIFNWILLRVNVLLGLGPDLLRVLSGISILVAVIAFFPLNRKLFLWRFAGKSFPSSFVDDVEQQELSASWSKGRL